MNRKLIEVLKIPEEVRVPVLGGISYKLLSKLDNKALDKAKIPDDALNHEKRDVFVTLSLTSYPARIGFVHKAIKSLMLQSYKPDRIVLFLANEQFPDKKLPDELTSLTKHGLEIKWCEDLYGHKKYYYCISEQKENEVVITFDDDIIYSPDTVKRLIKTHKKYPDCLVCERAQAIDYEKDGTLKNPGRWKALSSVGVKTPSFSLNPSPGGGCLIPYKGFYKDAYDTEKIRSLAYKNDDLWYMFMAAENGTRIIKTEKYHKTFTLIENSQEFQMAFENVIGDKNMVIMENLAKEYPTAYKRIITDKI